MTTTPVVLGLSSINQQSRSCPGLLPTTSAALQDLYGDQFAVTVAQAAAIMDRPEFNGRLQKAMDLVLTGAVTLHAEGTATVKSGSHTYQINGECSCADSQQRGKYCKHVLAVHLFKRTLERLHQPLPTNGATSQPTPEAPQAPQSAAWQCAQAPSSCTLKWSLNGIDLLLTLRDATDEGLFERITCVLPRIQDKVDVQRQARQEAQASQQASPPPAPEEEEPWCARHDVPLRRFSKGDQSWYSHPTPDGTWCRGK